jgi:pimeloyl-ACP methyl ester carboxylesterase
VVHLAVLRDGIELRYVERGDRDGVPVVLLHEWASEIPGARLVIYAGVGHLPVIEATKRVAADLTAQCDAVAAR